MNDFGRGDLLLTYNISYMQWSGMHTCYTLKHLEIELDSDKYERLQ